MVRVLVLALVAVVPAVGQRVAVYTADATSGDPLGLLTSIGVGGLLAAVVYLWQRDTAKQRDKATDQVAETIPLIQALQQVVQQNTEAQKAATDSVNEMIEMLRYWSPPTTPAPRAVRRREP